MNALHHLLAIQPLDPFSLPLLSPIDPVPERLGSILANPHACRRLKVLCRHLLLGNLPECAPSLGFSKCHKANKSHGVCFLLHPSPLSSAHARGTDPLVCLPTSTVRVFLVGALRAQHDGGGLLARNMSILCCFEGEHFFKDSFFLRHPQQRLLYGRFCTLSENETVRKGGLCHFPKDSSTTS